MEREDDFLGRRVVDAAGELLFGRFFGGGDSEANFTRLGGIEGGGEGLAEGLRAGVFGEHFSPGKDLHGVQQRAVGTKPGEEQGSDGKMFAHVGKKVVGADPSGIGGGVQGEFCGGGPEGGAAGG